MKSTMVHINELRVRASGMKPEQARRLGEMVANRIAEAPLSANQPRKIPAVTLRVRSSATNSVERIADDIAIRIHHSLS